MEAPHADLRSSATRELSRLGDINFASKTEDSVLTIDGGGFTFETMSLSKVSDVVTTNNNLGIGTQALSGYTSTDVVAIGLDGVGASPNVSKHSVLIGSKESTTGAFPKATASQGCGLGAVAVGASSLGNATAAGRGTLSVSLGAASSFNGAGTEAVHIGGAAGSAVGNTQTGSVVIGGSACSAGGGCGEHGICLGRLSGGAGTGVESISVGYLSRASGDRGIAVGSSASAAADSICIGANSTAASNGVCVGGNITGAADSVVINGTSASVAGVANGTVIQPLQAVPAAQTSLENHVQLPTTASTFDQLLVRSSTTGELRYVTLQTIP